MHTFDYSIFDQKSLLITGGTGSFGSTVLRDLLQNSNIGELRVFSRDEKKQHDLRLSLNSDKVRYIIGDVRDYMSIEHALSSVDYVFHAAALNKTFL